MLDVETKNCFIKIYCSSHYGSELWNLTNNNLWARYAKRVAGIVQGTWFRHLKLCSKICASDSHLHVHFSVEIILQYKKTPCSNTMTESCSYGQHWNQIDYNSVQQRRKSMMRNTRTQPGALLRLRVAQKYGKEENSTETEYRRQYGDSGKHLISTVHN